MPSEESMKKAREVLGLHPGREFSPDVYWNRLAGRVATALDEAKAERAEECAQIALGAHSRAKMRAEKIRFEAGLHHDQLAKAEEAMNIAAEIRFLTKGPSQ